MLASPAPASIGLSVIVQPATYTNEASVNNPRDGHPGHPAWDKCSRAASDRSGLCPRVDPMDAQLYRDFGENEDRHWWFTARREIVRGFIKSQLPSQTGNRIL